VNLIEILFENTVLVARAFKVSRLPPFLFPSQGKLRITSPMRFSEKTILIMSASISHGKEIKRGEALKL